MPSRPIGIEREHSPNTKETTMAKVAPWHSKLILDRNVYHDETRCTEGNNIESRNRVAGTGNKPKCHHCKTISG
jgi:hypothetical protein